MRRAEIVDKIVDAIISGESHPDGVRGLLLDDEIAQGGVEYPVSAKDWAATPVIVRRGGEVRIIAVISRRPGSLRRLVDRIRSEGLRPVIVSPIGDQMPTILRYWGWTKHVVGSGWEAVEEWRPPI